MTRPRHPNKEIEAAVQAAIDQGWSWRPVSGHAWGRLYCPHGEWSGCIISVWSTPRDAFTHARDIRREVSKCPH